MISRHFKLRPYQEECLASIPEQGAFLVCMSVGLGKTVTFSQIPRKGRMLILSHRDELVHQPEKYFDCSFGVEQGNETSHGEEVISASVQSLVRRLNKFTPEDFDVLVTDECFPAGTIVSGHPIETIKVGDYVEAFNHETERIEFRKVTRTFKRRMPLKMMFINGNLICTLNHPIYDCRTKTYKAAKNLSFFDELLTIGNCHIDYVKVMGFDYYQGGDGYVYNLEVEGLNNYFANGILVHNCHHATAPSYRKIYDYFKPRLHLGFTATPNRNDGVGLKAIYQDIIFERNLKWGIENNYLSRLKCLRVNLGVDLHRIIQRLGDFAPEALDQAINIEQANKAVAKAYEIYAKPPCLIFCASVAHAEALAKEIPGAVSVKGGEDRTEIVQAFKDGKIPCLTNCMVFTEGTDIPNIQTVIMARPTKNVSLYTQMAGRATRLYPDKKYALLIDCVGAGDNADLCTAPSLLGLDLKGVPEKYQEQVEGDLFDLPEIIESVSDTPEAWIKNVYQVDLWARRNSYNLHGVNYFRLPDGGMILNNPKLKLSPEDSLGRIIWNGRPEPAQKVFDEVYQILQNEHLESRPLWDLNIAKRWGSAEATEKQKYLVKRFAPKMDISRLTKLEAGQILTRCFAR